MNISRKFFNYLAHYIRERMVDNILANNEKLGCLKDYGLQKIVEIDECPFSAANTTGAEF